MNVARASGSGRWGALGSRDGPLWVVLLADPLVEVEELRGAEDNAPGLSQLVEVEALFDLGVGAENVGKG